MTKPSFTPGPWRRKKSANYGNAIEGKTTRRHFDGDEGWRIVATYQEACDSQIAADQDANWEANGNLIAAAPELYDALEDLVSDIETDGGVDTSVWPILDAAKAALAKARGETP